MKKPENKINLVNFIKPLSGKVFCYKQYIGLVIGTILLFVFCSIMKVNFLLAALLLSLMIFFKFFYNSHLKRNYKLIYPVFLYVIFFAVIQILINNHINLYVTPLVAFSMLSTILFGDLILTLLFLVACVFTMLILHFVSLQIGLIFLISGIISAFFCLEVRKRNTLIEAGFLISVLQLVLFFICFGFSPANSKDYVILFFNAILSSLIVIAVLPVFEFLFNTITNINLLELADFNHEALNKLMLEAPGTYHHSLIVGNLSEAACRAVGANALLARIGAYYHDIGKLNKPEYFSENQSLITSKHDELAPSMSKLIIMKHVKEGIDLGKKYKLNPRILDFIQQHHGTSLVYFFYRRALEKSEDNQDIQEGTFRYPGPKPDTKETAIVLLADSVEAASRAMREPTPDKIKESVHKIINNKFIDGQLDNCDLTLKDLETIAKVFLHILTGMYHTRITYPEVKSGQDLDKKSSKDSQT